MVDASQAEAVTKVVDVSQIEAITKVASRAVHNRSGQQATKVFGDSQTEAIVRSHVWGNCGLDYVRAFG